MSSLVSYLTLLVLCLCVVFLFHFHTPTVIPLSSSTPPHSNTTFETNHVYHHIEWLAASSRPIGTKANAIVRAQLSTHLQGLVKRFPHRQLQLVHGEGHTQYMKNQFPFPFLGKEIEMNINTTVVLQNSNIYFRIPGTKELNEGDRSSLLLSAHFDSVPSSKGVGDNAVAVATLLEIIRILLSNEPLVYSLLFCFNNGEEILLQGAMELLHNAALWKDVVAFLNLDAMCPTGRPLLFRSSSPFLLQLFQSSIQFPHAHSLGQELMDHGWIHSLTDYSIYSKLGGKPGLDFAFYDNRWVYHTMDDQIGLLQPSSILHLGHFLWNLIQAVNAHGGIPTRFDPMTMTNTFLYFDILGHYLWMMSFRAFTWLCLGTFGVLYLLNFGAPRPLVHLISVKEYGWFLARLLTCFSVGVLTPWLAMTANPHISSGYPYLPPFLSFIASVTLLYFFENQTKLRTPSKVSFLKTSKFIAYFYLFCLCVSAWFSFYRSSVFAHWYLMALAYLSVYTLFTYVGCWAHPWSPFLLLFVPSLFSFPILLDLIWTFLASISFTVQEGTPLFVMAFVYAFFLFPLFLPFLPWLTTRSLSDLRSSFFHCVILLVTVLVLTLFLWPYPSSHPLKFHLQLQQSANVDLERVTTDHVPFTMDSLQSNLPLPFPTSTEPLLVFPTTSVKVHSGTTKLTFTFPTTGGILMCLTDPPRPAQVHLPTRNNVSFPFVYIHTAPTSFHVDVLFSSSFVSSLSIQCQFSNTELIHPQLALLIHSLPVPSHARVSAKTWDYLVSTYTIHFRLSSSFLNVMGWKK